MEWGWIAAPIVAVLIGLSGWQWRLSGQLANKVDRSEHDRRLNELSKELVDHKYNVLDKFVSKVDLDRRFEHIDQTLEKHDEKFDLLIDKVTTLTAITKKL